MPPQHEHVSAPAPRVAAVTLAPARIRLFVPSRAWGGRRRREILFAAAAIAVLFHALLTIAILEAPRLWPPPPAAAANPPEPPSMEMVMDQNRFAGGSKPTPPTNPTLPAPKAPPAPPKPQAAPAPSEAPPSSAPDAESLPPDAATRGPVQAPPPSPPQQPVPQQPDVDLDPADALGYGHQDDPRIVPASPDNSHANKMPPYPRAAGRRGEEGPVQMLVSIGADGAVQAVEIAVSSGYPDLDRTAEDAVARWHFRPAMQNGAPVPTHVMQTFNFHIVR